jgi:hypothetical protein
MRIGSLSLALPALVCQATIANSEFHEEYAHVLAHVLPEGQWLALGAGDGLAIAWDESGVGLDTENEARVTVKPATTPFDLDAWER